jgi:hypothetical protein
MTRRLVKLLVASFLYGQTVLAQTLAPSPLPPVRIGITQSPTSQSSPAPTTAQPTPFPTTRPPTLPPTPAPTPQPTPAPTPQPTALPSKAPTGMPSVAPSATPSQYPRSPVTGRAELMFRPVSGLLIGDTEQVFLEYATAFLTQNIPQVESITLEIERQARQQQNRRSLREEALFVDIRVRASRIIMPDEIFNFDTALMELFESSEQDFIQSLKNTGDPYFEVLTSVILPDTAAPTSAPSALPSLSPEIEDEGLSQEYLIAIIAGGTFVVLVVLFMFYRCACSQKGKQLETDAPSGVFFRASKRQSFNQVPAGVSSDVESQQALNSPTATQSDGQSSYYGGSIMQASTHMDSNSYSYSLEPGIEPSVVSGKSNGSAQGRPVPMEIPQLDNGIELAPSDLQLTESELAMLPSNLGKSGESEVDELVTRVVVAPPGKLGIIIDTTVEGPVVHKINPGSALEGQLSPGEIIVAIDDVGTRAMSASAITALMVKTANKQRNLTVASNPN